MRKRREQLPPVSSPAKTQDRRSKLPLLAASAVAIVLIGAAVYLFREYRDFRHELTVCNSVRLTDSRTDVLYRLGPPTEVLGPVESGAYYGFQPLLKVDGPAGDQNAMPSTKKLDDYDGWVYDVAEGNLTIEFDKIGKVDVLSIYANSTKDSAWGPIAGIRNGDPEESVLSLGTPTSNTIDGSTRVIEFADIGVCFYLVKGRAYMVKLRHPAKGEGALFWAFLHTLPTTSITQNSK